MNWFYISKHWAQWQIVIVVVLNLQVFTAVARYLN